MKTLKRISGLIVTVTLCLGLATGCGKRRDKPDTDPPVEDLNMEDLGIDGGEDDEDSEDDDKESGKNSSGLQLNPPANG